MLKVTHLSHTKKTPTPADNARAYMQAIKEKITTDRALGRLYAKSPLDDKDAIIFDGEVKSVLVRKPLDDEKCVIDWINITLDARQFHFKTQNPDDKPSERQNQDHAIGQISKALLRIIGFGVDYENETGRNFYQRAFTLEHKTGFVCIGGQGDTVLIMINGTGCNYASIGWEIAMFDWLSNLYAVSITRIDLAHDVLDNNALTVDLFSQVHAKGGFNKGGRNPDIEHRGNWKNPNGKGRTLYIGSRQSSKFCRIYEKGKQLGDPDSNWLRIEVEFKSRDIYIPLSVLLHPTDYFIAAYPCFFLIEEDKFLDRYEIRAKNELLTFDRALEILKTQYGRYLYFFRQCYQDDTKLLDELTAISNKKIPDKLDMLTIPRHLNTPKPLDLGEPT